MAPTYKHTLPQSSILRHAVDSLHGYIKAKLKLTSQQLVTLLRCITAAAEVKQLPPLQWSALLLPLMRHSSGKILYCARKQSLCKEILTFAGMNEYSFHLHFKVFCLVFISIVFVKYWQILTLVHFQYHLYFAFHNSLCLVNYLRYQVAV